MRGALSNIGVTTRLGRVVQYSRVSRFAIDSPE
jgi:hypothetical protein